MANRPNRTPLLLSSRLQRRLTGWERLEDRMTPCAVALDSAFGGGGTVAYNLIPADFVKVDSETTTQNDINLGIVNVVIGFAPLKPAEFVIITLQQRAGQVSV